MLAYSPYLVLEDETVLRVSLFALWIFMLLGTALMLKNGEIFYGHQ